MRRALAVLAVLLVPVGAGAAATDVAQPVAVEITADGVTFPGVADLSTLTVVFDPPGAGQPQRPSRPLRLHYGQPHCFELDVLLEGESLLKQIAALERSLAGKDGELPAPVLWTSDNDYLSSLQSVLLQVTTRYTMFSQAGTPVRATASLRLRAASPGSFNRSSPSTACSPDPL